MEFGLQVQATYSSPALDAFFVTARRICMSVTLMHCVETTELITK